MAGKGGGPYPTMQRPFSVLSLLLIALVRSEDLKVTMGTSLISAKIGETVIISCYISNIDINKVLAVEWKQTFENGTEKDVYVYNNGGVTPYREGSSMDVEEIRNGNANLHLPSVQISDDGEYTCSVINTPRHALGKTALQVSVQPSVTVTPEDVTIELGTEKSVMCEVSNFYPQTVTIHWVQFNKAFPGYVTLKNGICTAEHITNNDGTFNITSHMTLSPKKADDGSSYGCVVTHRSRDQETMKNFTLTVTEREDYTGTIVGAMFGTLLCTLLTVACVLIYWMRFKKDPPILSAITGNDELTDMSRTTLTCQMIDYRPDNISVCVCLSRRGQQEEIIYAWRPRDSTSPAWLIRGGDPVILNVKEQYMLDNGAARQDERPLQLEVVPVVSRSKLGSFSCQCSLHITPSYDLDNGAELSIHVAHPALTSPISVLRVLKVTGVPPRLNYIIGPYHQTPNENMTLTCPINDFKPHPLSIMWLRRDKNSQETKLITREPETQQQQHSHKYSHHVIEDKHDDYSYSCLSILTFRPTVKDDHGITYICRTFHPATQQQAEKELTISLIAFPQFDEIQKKQEVVCVGEKLDLSCRIHSFYPAKITVKWYTQDDSKNKVSIPSGTSDPLQEPNSGLYHVTTKVSYTPAVKDLNKIFQCEVQEETAEPRYVTWTLSELFSQPHVGEIRSDPAEPVRGQTVTLSCAVSNMYPGDAHVQWFHGSGLLHSERPIFQEESGMFSGTIKLTLDAMDEHHGAPIRMQITHAAKMITKEFIMKLKGFPVVGDITSDPRIGEYGKPLTLTCRVTGGDLSDISKVTWAYGGQLAREKQKETQATGESLVCTLMITPTAEDYGRIYTCSIHYKSMQLPFTRNVTLRLPEKPPTLSDIMVRPEMVRANQETSLQVTVSGFSPRDLQVKWYKGFSQFHSTAVTSSEPRIGGDNLYTLTSTLTFTPSQKDDKVSIRCEVTHSASRTIREKHYTLNL
ncbi:hemicentin-1-like [Hyperolius riggenbachi]|uniref:hemicentin-1-like n=1 Tax=Hyperolius riggenbachi TaxID=752182 RepID=UPI0035A391E1